MVANPVNRVVERETKWNRWFRTEPHTLQGESKFQTGEVRITLEELSHLWPTWNTEERADFISAFDSKDESHYRAVFRFLVANASLADRRAFHWALVTYVDRKESLEVCLRWLRDPETPNRQSLFWTADALGKDLGDDRAAEALEEILDRNLDGQFWDYSTWRGDGRRTRALEIAGCSEVLYDLTKRGDYLRMLKRLSYCPDSVVAEKARWHLRGLGIGWTKFHSILYGFWWKIRKSDA